MDFIVIDDSKVDCFIAEKVIRGSDWCSSCVTFQTAAQALDYIREKKPDGSKTIIFVDEYMPMMTGLDFVEAFGKLDVAGKECYSIFLLSSSISRQNNGDNNPLIKKFIKKPLMNKTINAIFNQESKFLFHE